MRRPPFLPSSGAVALESGVLSPPVSLFAPSARRLELLSPCRPLPVYFVLSSTLPLALGRLLWPPRASFSRLARFDFWPFVYFERYLPPVLVCTPAFVRPFSSGHHLSPLLLGLRALDFGLLAQF